MFEQLVESSSTKRSKGRSAFFIATAVVWMSAMASVVIAGVFAVDARLDEQFVRLAIPLTPLPLESGPRTKGPVETNKGPARASGFTPAPQTPIEIGAPLNLPPVHALVSGNLTGGGNEASGGGRGNSLIGIPGAPEGGSQPPAPHPPQPAQPTKEEEPKPQVLRISTGPLQGSALRRVEPVYPPLAITTRTKGSVVVEVVISEQGEVISVRAISGHPLLRDAALKAASGWKWKPTYLNDVPVRVVGTITFNFVL
jgi:protein TonB